MFAARSITAAIALAVAAGTAAADTVQMRFTGTTPYLRSVTVTVLSQPGHSGNTVAGALNHQFDGPATGYGQSLVGRTLQTWCIELQSVNSTLNPYSIVEVEDAPVAVGNNPNGSGPYGLARANRAHAIMGAARNAGWIDGHLQMVVNASLDTLKDRAAAIQLLLWESLFEPGSNAVPVGWDLADGNFRSTTTAGMATQVATLVSDASVLLQGGYRFGGMRAVAGTAGQDQLVVVPLPPAAFASVAVLGLLGSIRAWRKNHPVD